MNNIIVSHEVIHSMKRKIVDKGWMVIKIDLEKAYDHLKQEFVKDILLEIGLPDVFVEMVWSCISTSSAKVIWNGEALNSFSPSRGIR